MSTLPVLFGRDLSRTVPKLKTFEVTHTGDIGPLTGRFPLYSLPQPVHPSRLHVHGSCPLCS
jgi:hypothetical protein